jgi:hypothetical protein
MSHANLSRRSMLTAAASIAAVPAVAVLPAMKTADVRFWPKADTPISEAAALHSGPVPSETSDPRGPDGACR